MAKKNEIKKKSLDTTVVKPSFIITKKDKQNMANQNELSRMAKNDTTRLKNLANIKAKESLTKRNLERVSSGQKVLRPKPTLTAKDLKK